MFNRLRAVWNAMGGDRRWCIESLGWLAAGMAFGAGTNLFWNW